MAALLDLATRLEQAKGPDRELDFDIARALGWTQHTDEDDPVHLGRVSTWWKHPLEESWSTCSIPPSFTASIDAAMTLVPEGPSPTGELFKVEAWDKAGGSVHPEHVRATAWVPGARRTYAATPALALCAAALRARHAQEDTDNRDGVL